MNQTFFFLNFLADSDQQKLSQLSQYDIGISVEKLWIYSCSITKDRNISCITWNRRNQVRISFFCSNLKLTQKIKLTKFPN